MPYSVKSGRTVVQVPLVPALVLESHGQIWIGYDSENSLTKEACFVTHTKAA